MNPWLWARAVVELGEMVLQALARLLVIALYIALLVLPLATLTWVWRNM